jgi:DNA-3-methyladenine glycosylase II
VRHQALAFSVATVRRTLSERFGAKFELAGTTEAAFPQPECLLASSQLNVPGLGAEKELRLRGVANAAQEGLLDVQLLHSLGTEGAYQALQRLHGIGPFYAGLIVLRASGFTDAMLPVAEPKVLAHVAHFYGLSAPPTLDRFTAMADAGVPSEHGQRS